MSALKFPNANYSYKCAKNFPKKLHMCDFKLKFKFFKGVNVQDDVLSQCDKSS